MEAALSHLGSGALVLLFTSPKIEDFGGGGGGAVKLAGYDSCFLENTIKYKQKGALWSIVERMLRQ